MSFIVSLYALIKKDKHIRKKVLCSIPIQILIPTRVHLSSIQSTHQYPLSKRKEVYDIWATWLIMACSVTMSCAYVVKCHSLMPNFEVGRPRARSSNKLKSFFCKLRLKRTHSHGLQSAVTSQSAYKVLPRCVTAFNRWIRGEQESFLVPCKDCARTRITVSAARL